MIYARQSTAIIVTVGPVLDADGVAVTDCVVGDFKASKNGGAPAALNGSATLTHRNTGHYSLSLTTTDVNTVGTLEIVIDDTVNACPMKEIQVIEPAVYDRDYADAAVGYIANQPVDVNTIKTQTVTCAAGVTVSPFVGNATAAILVNASGHVSRVALTDTATTVTNQLTAAAIATGVWQDATAGDFTVASSIGKALYIANIVPGASGGHFIAGSNAGTTTVGALTVTGALTAGSNAVPWNAAYDAEVQSEVADALTAFWTSPATLVDLVWDEVLTGATHNVSTSAGKRLREITNSVSQSGTAQAGSTNTITLAAAASSTDGTYDPAIVRISGGTGAGQARLVIHYTGSTRVAVVDRDWRTSPDNTSEYEIIASPNLHSTNEGLAQGGGASTITLNASASSTDDVYNGQLVVIRTGPGQDQSRIITDYVGSTKVATVGEAWATNPTSSSGYMIWPVGRALVTEYVSGQEPPTAGAIATAVAAEIGDGSALTEAGGTGDHLTALATQASVNDLPTNAELALRTLLAAEYGTAANQTTIAGYLDTEVAAIKAKTDQLTFTQANVLDANILYVNGTQVTGDGETGTEWGPA